MVVRLTGILVLLHGFNVEKFQQTLLKVAGVEGRKIWETAATIPFSIKLGLLEFYKKGGIEIWRYE